MMLDNRSLLRRGVVELLNSGQAVTTASASLAAGVSMVEFYPSVGAVYVDIVNALVQAHTHNRPDTLGRRRSPSQALGEQLASFWDVVVEHAPAHRAVQILRLTHPQLRVCGPAGSSVPLHQLATLWAARWVAQQGAVQGLAWRTPVPLLAQGVVATLDGLLTHQLTSPDAGGQTELLELFSYHLAKQGNRNRPKRTP